MIFKKKKNEKINNKIIFNPSETNFKHGFRRKNRDSLRQCSLYDESKSKLFLNP